MTYAWFKPLLVALLTAVFRHDHQEAAPRGIPLILIVTVLSMVYSLAAGALSGLITGAPTHGNPLMGETIDAERVALIFVQLFGEELFKINMLLGILLLLFRRSNNRKSAVVIAVFARKFGRLARKFAS